MLPSIPPSVLDMLDGMKKEKGNFAARDAIKFLEREFQQKNRFATIQFYSSSQVWVIFSNLPVFNYDMHLVNAHLCIGGTYIQNLICLVIVRMYVYYG